MTGTARPAPQPGATMNDVSGIVRMNLAAMDTADLKLLRSALLNQKVTDFDNERLDRLDRLQWLLEAIQDELDLRRQPVLAAAAGPGTTGGDPVVVQVDCEDGCGATFPMELG